MAEQIEPGFDDFRMADRNLYPLLQLRFKPSFPLFGGHVGGEDGNADAFPRQDAFQAASHVALLGIDRIDVAAAARSQFSLDDLQQATLFGLETLPLQILGSGNQEAFPPLSLGIELPSQQFAYIIGPVWVH